MADYTEDELRMYSAWSDYRKEYGASGAEAHAEFIAGWWTARNNLTMAHGNRTQPWQAGYDAFWDNLDIGGVMR